MVTKTPLLATLSAEVLLRRCSYNQNKLDLTGKDARKKTKFQGGINNEN
jgi:hypothetical protein